MMHPIIKLAFKRKGLTIAQVKCLKLHKITDLTSKLLAPIQMIAPLRFYYCSQSNQLSEVGRDLFSPSF